MRAPWKDYHHRGSELAWRTLNLKFDLNLGGQGLLIRVAVSDGTSMVELGLTDLLLYDNQSIQTSQHRNSITVSGLSTMKAAEVFKIICITGNRVDQSITSRELML